jgi:RND superfamily putative drug exporter
MASPFSTEGLASVSARHPWRVILTWLTVLVIAGVYALTGLSDVVSNDMELTNDYESVVGLNKLSSSETLSDTANASETILLRSLDGTTADDPAFAERANSVVGAIRQLQGDWEGAAPKGPPTPQDLLEEGNQGSQVINYFELKPFGAPETEQLLNADRTVLLIPATFAQENSILNIPAYLDVVEQFDSDRFDVTSIGVLSINEVFSGIAADDLIQGEMIGLPIALLVLIIVFGALVAPGLPIVLGLFSIGIALGIVTLAGQFGQLQLFIENMVTMLGLAIGIDYALFIVERYREQRRLGYNRQRAIEIAGGTAGKAVLFSGITVILALVGVMLVPFNIFFSLGLGAVIVVAVAVMLTLTLLPAMLSLLGDRIVGAHDTPGDHYEGFWGRATRIVVARPVFSMLAAVTLLGLLALPVLDLRTGFTGTAQMPPGEVTDAYAVLESEFSAGVLAPVDFVFEGEHTANVDAAIADFQTKLTATGEFAPFSEPVRWDENLNLAVFTGTMIHAPSSDEAYALIDHIRSDIVPATVGEVGGLDTWVTGQSAIENDTITMLGDRTPVVFAFVLTLSFILLTLAFRSLVVPLQAIVFNLLSVGATWGIMVLVFSKGFLLDFFGFHASPVIESWIPILLFCILFGLSMDYHVFILSRIREHYDISHNNSESVAVGLKSTGKIITGAALIMVVIFGAFSTGSLLALQQLGFGLAVAVLLDATIVRSVLVPSVMTLLGDRNWWLPGWLSWLPDLRIEGEVPAPTPALAQERELVAAEA